MGVSVATVRPANYHRSVHRVVRLAKAGKLFAACTAVLVMISLVPHELLSQKKADRGRPEKTDP